MHVDVGDSVTHVFFVVSIKRDKSMTSSDVNRIKAVVNLARRLAKLNETNQHIDVIEFSRLLNLDDVFLFLEEYCFYAQQRRRE